MSKKDWKSKAKALKRDLKALKATLDGAAPEVPAKPAKAAKPVSPLAPASFPTLPVIRGAEFAAIGAGIKYLNRKDVMLVRLAPGTTMAGVFTRSTTRSGCVRDCQTKLATRVPDGAGAAIIVNSGNSNAFTGAVGDRAVAEVTGGVAAALGIPATRVFSSSTGVIGEPLPFEKITAVIPALAAELSEAAIQGAAEAIMTTDTFPKVRSASRGRRRADPYLRHRQGLGHDRAGHGDDAELRLHRCPIAPGAAKDAARNVDEKLQRDDRRQRHLDLRYLLIFATGKADDPIRSRARLPRRLKRALRRADAQLAHACGPRRRRGDRSRGHALPGATNDRAPIDAFDRQLTAGEDRDRGRGRELGSHRDAAIGKSGEPRPTATG
jgi:hypothetical protein